MTTTQVVVTIVGLCVVAGIVWYFWLWTPGQAVARTAAGGVQEVEVTVRGGYEPASIVVEAGKPVVLRFTRREPSTCGEEVVIPGLGKRAYLPENQPVTVEVTPERPGEYEFTCGMNMYRGKLIAR
ncbi:MAG: cupredoxin domain-containing protein [Gemmataceae bacterium]|nr:cupredoxin domain-containing protein [Gemmataceae bacterium]